MHGLRRGSALSAAAILAAACASGPPAPEPGAAAAGAGSEAAAPPAEDAPDHQVFREGWSRQAATHDDMTRRIRESARQLEAQGGVPRVAFVDLRVPGSAREREALGGHGVLRLTAVCRDPAELPPARVYVQSGEGETWLRAIRGRLGQVPDSEAEILRVVGRARLDALYLMPLHLAARPGALVVDFAQGRRGFVLGELPVLPAEAGPALDPASAAAPDRAALEALIARELPEFASPEPPPAP